MRSPTTRRCDSESMFRNWQRFRQYGFNFRRSFRRPSDIPESKVWTVCWKREFVTSFRRRLARRTWAIWGIFLVHTSPAKYLSHSYWTTWNKRSSSAPISTKESMEWVRRASWFSSSRKSSKTLKIAGQERWSPQWAILRLLRECPTNIASPHLLRRGLKPPLSELSPHPSPTAQWPSKLARQCPAPKKFGEDVPEAPS